MVGHGRYGHRESRFGQSFLGIGHSTIVQEGVDGADGITRVTLVLVLALAHRMTAAFEGPGQADFFGSMFGDGAVVTLHESGDRGVL